MHQSTVTILYTSDVHGHAMPIQYGTNKKEDIGLAKYATVVEEHKESEENLIVIDNGDLIQGTPLMTHYVKEHLDKPNPMVGIMNRLQIDAGVIGNHEFNFGHAVLQQAIHESNFPWLSANIINIQTKEPAFGPPYIIKTFNNGITAAIIGVTTHYIPNWESTEHIEGLSFEDAFDILNSWVSYIKENEQPDIVIAAYHGGFEKDLHTGEATEDLTGENQGYQMVEEIEGIDILLTGHQHRRINELKNNVIVLQPGHNGQAYGKAEITLIKDKQDKWMIDSKKGHIQQFTDVKSNQQVLNYMEALESSTQTWLDQPIGKIDGDMVIHDSFQARINKHPFIEFIHKVQMDAAEVDISVSALLNNTSKGFSSEVTMRDIVSNYMYPNTLTVLELTGQDIKDALEKSAEYFTIEDNQIIVNPSFVEPKPQHYNYDIWHGIDYTMNISNPPGDRVSNMCYHGEPIKSHDTFHVVLNNYRASGGGNYDMFKHKKVVKEIQKDAVELIQTYFEKHPRVAAITTNNYQVVMNHN
ncbi:bifunctional metallophosphatase/5'-nucleotidase [Oceanobacillus kimchii]|uniref:2',3'-cyclic-nucleotide 2'-phosphodiesterase n=1 Tax=Oceanobacillus kimchii TaxID=746691 RepID=A0ABQ5TK91_9BACI|nr:bifunctional UDP-sugar hydrolase/5'-nucleotidase [Oceanobacillus kimchii]GLO64932.1 2',3'-cyclic-nucleotide 2'-phosphodiesterase [Oceanobacillus kimchii]